MNWYLCMITCAGSCFNASFIAPRVGVVPCGVVVNTVGV